MLNRKYVHYQGREVPNIYGSKGGCFPAGTLITMADGTKKPIEHIDTTDIVLGFKKFGQLGPASVTETFYHEDDAVLKVEHQRGVLNVTPNHWVIGSDGLFKEIQEFEVGDEIVLESGTPSTIKKITQVENQPVYTFTVPETQTYIADDIRVHNKGGGKGGSGGGKEDPNDLFSTDILFVTSSLGEGPIFRVNPNGPQDIEINDGNIDDMINLDGDGQENGEFFRTEVNTGTTTQAPLPVFGEQTVVPQNFSSPVTLKKGNVSGVPRSRILLQSTSAKDWDSIKFVFVIGGLQESKSNGDIVKRSLSVKVTVFDHTGTDILVEKEQTITGKTNTPFKFTIIVLIPDAEKSTDGYKFTIEKTSDDSDSSKVQETVQSIGWFEIQNSPQAYPRTATIGYAMKAFSEHTGGVPNFTSLVKGLLVKVPTNYNQPITSIRTTDDAQRNFEIDWRELELPETGTFGYAGGYTLQKTGPGTVLSGANPQIYVGNWDGNFVYSWTQNPVWIMYDLLTNKTYGLGIAEANVDRFKFYRVAKYCDACDDVTGQFIGVDGIADGTFRHKPRGQFTTVREALIGIPEGTKIKERRFTFDGIIQDQGQALDLLNQIAASIRGALVYAGGKITLAVDLPDELPVAVFNESNIKEGSVNISGIKESEMFTGVDVSYIDPTNHYKRETVRIDTTDANDGTDRSVIENIASLDLFGVTRRSQALRYAQYHIAAAKYLRRKIDFITGLDALMLAPGDVISIAQRQIGIAFGYGGKLARDSNTTSGHANLMLEHFTVPSITSSVFTANTHPLALRVIQLDSERIDLYTVDVGSGRGEGTGKFAVLSTGNVSAGADLIEVRLRRRYDPITKTLSAFDAFTANNLPKRGDLWSLGEWNTQYESPNIYQAQTDKLFKITSIGREPETEEVSVSAIEYVSNVYVDSDTFIDYTPTAYLDTKSPLIAPPAPVFNLRTVPTREQDGSVRVDLIVENFSEDLNYGLNFETEYFVSLPDESQLVANAIPNEAGGFTPGKLKFNAANINALTDGDNPATIAGKNGFDSLTGKVRLLCNAVSVAAFADTTLADSSNLKLVVEGMNVLHDFNFLEARVRTITGIALNNPIRITTSAAHGLVNGRQITTNVITGTTQLNGVTSFAKRITDTTFDLFTDEALTTGRDGTSGFTAYASGGQVHFNDPTPLLEVNDGDPAGVFGSLKGHDAVTVPISVTQTGGARNFVASGPSVTAVSANIRLADGPNNHIYIDNDSDILGSAALLSKLPTPPFYIEVFQLLDNRFFNERANFFVGGSEFTFVQKNTVTPSSTHVEPLQIKPVHENFVKVFLDNIETTTFTLNKSTQPATISVVTDADDSTIRVEIDHYTVPAIEIGDNIQFSTGNVFVVSNTSYDTASPTYNVTMSQNNIFQVELATTPKANLSGVTLVNLATNPVGSIADISVANKTFNVVYDSGTFPGNFRLANTGIYQLLVGGEFEKTFLAKDRILRDIPIGTTSLKARNRNITGRFSPSVTKTVTVEELPIRKVSSITIGESLYIQQVGGVAVRAIITFPHITGQEVTDYELSYKFERVQNFPEPDGSFLAQDIVDIGTFSTVKIPANQVDDTGNITHVINNIDRGSQPSVIRMTVQVTPLNKNLRGIVRQQTKDIVGKTSKPKNITNLGAGQSAEQLTLFWNYPRTQSLDLVDLDLKEVVIRRNPGIVAATEENFNNAEDFLTVAAGVSRKSHPIDVFGSFSYLAKTRDTSGNLSDSVVVTNLTTFRPGGKTVFKVFNTDSPTVPISGIAPDNSTEVAFVSFNATNQGGNNVAHFPGTDPANIQSTPADNANASASGWTYDAASSPSDITAEGASATYITPIRDMGGVITASIGAEISGTQVTKSTFRDFQEDIYSGAATEAQTGTPQDDELRDTNFGGIGTVLGFSNTAFPDGSSFSVSFNEQNQTLVDNETSQNVYAIINPGQYTGNVKTISGITKASPAVITTSQDHGLTVTTAISAITKANPAVVTAASHGFSNGDQVLILNVEGMTQLNGTTKTVANKTDDTFQLSGTDSSGFGTYTSGGTAARVSTTTRIIIHDVGGMTEINNRELFAKYTSNTTAELYENSGASTPLNSGGFTTYTSGGVTDRGDFANANAMALIHRVLAADRIELAETFKADGSSTGGNNFANVTTANGGVNNYKLVNLKQFKDVPTTTFAGSGTAVSTETFLRTSSVDPETLFTTRTESEIVSGEGVHSNSNVNVASFDSFAINEGFLPYEVGSRSFRFYQIKFVVTNTNPNEFDFTLDKFRVTIEKDQTTFTNTATFDNTIKFVSFETANFGLTPAVTLTPINTATAQVCLTVETTNSHVAFKVFDIQAGSLVNHAALPAGSLQVSVSASGV